MELTNERLDGCHIHATVWRVSCGFHRLLIPRINVNQQLLSSSGRYSFGICTMIRKLYIFPHSRFKNPYIEDILNFLLLRYYIGNVQVLRYQFWSFLRPPPPSVIRVLYLAIPPPPLCLDYVILG